MVCFFMLKNIYVFTRNNIWEVMKQVGAELCQAGAQQVSWLEKAGLKSMNDPSGLCAVLNNRGEGIRLNYKKKEYGLYVC